METPSGFLLVDKPPGPTSHDVVDMARRAVGTRKVAHAGTLDPLASGLLILAVGKATKEISKFGVSLVALPTARMRRPEAKGSSVPAWRSRSSSASTRRTK